LSSAKNRRRIVRLWYIDLHLESSRLTLPSSKTFIGP